MTTMQRSSISPFNFTIRILGVGIGLVVLAYLLSSAFHFHLGLALFILGILSMGMGNLLSLPARRYERQCGVKHFSLFQLPAPEEYIAGDRFTVRRAASFYYFENALTLAGFMIVLAGLIILF